MEPLSTTCTEEFNDVGHVGDTASRSVKGGLEVTRATKGQVNTKQRGCGPSSVARVDYVIILPYQATSAQLFNKGKG